MIHFKDTASMQVLFSRGSISGQAIRAHSFDGISCNWLGNSNRLGMRYVLLLADALHKLLP